MLTIPDLKITDLLTKKGINRFKDKFSLQADEFKNLDLKERLSPEFTAEIYVTDIKGNESKYDYSQHYFPRALSKMSEIYLKDLKGEAYNIYATDARINFLNQKLSEIQQVIENYRCVEDLNSTDKAMIISELEKLSDRLSNKMQDLVQVSNDKITFNLKKNEVLILFKLFHELDIIKGISIYELMRFVENHINFKDSKEIKGANKSLNTEIARMTTAEGGKVQLNKTALLKLINSILKL